MLSQKYKEMFRVKFREKDTISSNKKLNTQEKSIAQYRKLQCYFYARERYSFVRVSTFTRSPTLMKRGTWTTRPVVSVAGFFPPVAVSHFSPGGVSTTSSSQLGSRLTLIGFPLNS